MLDTQTPAGGAWSRVRDGTCQEEVGHERHDNKEGVWERRREKSSTKISDTPRPIEKSARGESKWSRLERSGHVEDDEAGVRKKG